MKKIVLAVIVVLMVSGNLFSQVPLSFGVKIGTDVTLGKFKDEYKNGFSSELGVYYAMPLRGLALSATIGFDNFRYQSQYLIDQVSTNFPGVTLTDFNPGWTASDMPVMFGAKYTFPAGTAKIYLTGELGVHFVNFADRLKGQQINGSSNSEMTLSLAGNTETKSESAFGYAFGGGMEIPMSKKTAFDIGAKYNFTGVKISNAYTIFRNSNEQFTTSEIKNLNYVTVRGGIVIHL
jgi:hypothetical protein